VPTIFVYVRLWHPQQLLLAMQSCSFAPTCTAAAFLLVALLVLQADSPSCHQHATCLQVIH
jgi:hypothetical protein